MASQHPKSIAIDLNKGFSEGSVYSLDPDLINKSTVSGGRGVVSFAPLWPAVRVGWLYYYHHHIIINHHQSTPLSSFRWYDS